tara:strand:+ start:4007 stop:4339 length:333 start_codon:yes stop_codon:yes gene_type:complete
MIGNKKGSGNLYRATDPMTSRLAAETAPVTSMKELALDLIRKYPYSTAREIEYKAGKENGVLRKRLASLERERRVVKRGVGVCKVTGRKASVYEALPTKPQSPQGLTSPT